MKNLKVHNNNVKILKVHTGQPFSKQLLKYLKSMLGLETR